MNHSMHRKLTSIESPCRGFVLRKLGGKNHIYVAHKGPDLGKEKPLHKSLIVIVSLFQRGTKYDIIDKNENKELLILVQSPSALTRSSTKLSVKVLGLSTCGTL